MRKKLQTEDMTPHMIGEPIEFIITQRKVLGGEELYYDSRRYYAGILQAYELSDTLLIAHFEGSMESRRFDNREVDIEVYILVKEEA
jgi:hypothetical protein